MSILLKGQTNGQTRTSQKLNFLNDKNKVAAKLYFHYNDGKGDILLEAPTNNDAVDKKLRVFM